jgi:nucleotide-binding universal stress UspA family protein
MKRILCPTDFSDAAANAERQAIDLARALSAELVLLHVASEAPLWSETLYTSELRIIFEGQRKWAEQTLAARAKVAAAEGVTARSAVRCGVAWQEIIAAAADEHADMIVMGTHGRTGLDRMLMGSVAERVVRLAPCPVLTVRLSDGRREGGRLATAAAHGAE